MAAYYNEIDPYAAEWLRNLIKAGHIADGEVDERSIVDVRPGDIAGFNQCHFFAGIGVWSYALRLAGWPDDRPVWTGSCPCQPFSAAGKGKGFDDERHLWPVFHRLIAECRPAIVVGEQVASADGLQWLDLVCADLEDAGYAAGAADLCAAGVGSPHIRQRLWWVGERLDDATGTRHDGSVQGAESYSRDRARLRLLGAGRGAGRVADAGRAFGEWRPGAGGPAGDEAAERIEGAADHQRDGDAGRLADADLDGSQGRLRGWPGPEREALDGSTGRGSAVDLPGQTDGFWRDADWLFCRDGRWRPVEPGTFPLAHGATSRVGRLRAYGNAIVPQVAATFIKAVMET